MSNDTSDNTGTHGVIHADSYKIQTAEALEAAARRLRSADISANSDDVKSLLNDVELRVRQIKTEVSDGVEKVEEAYHKKVEPVEHIIIDHPIPAVLVAAGIGVLIGMLLFRNRD